ncbi:hypothetical protein C8F01DRAFT_1077920 [Mycena amicta]|nr:hypothetical protein C8F01DRAFT_1077920 [Mycena amicta]
MHNFSPSPSQLYSSVVLSALSLIPHHVLRITAVVLCLVMALIYVLVNKRPTVLLAELDNIIHAATDAVSTATAGRYFGRENVSLAEENVQLLRIRRSASIFHCCLLEPTHLSWKDYIRLSQEISTYTEEVKEILVRVQLLVEANAQQFYADSINSSQLLLDRVRA